MLNKIICFDARNLNPEDSMLQLVYNLNYQYILISDCQYDNLRLPHKIKLIIQMDEFKEIGNSENVIIMSKNINVLKAAEKAGYIGALYNFIGNKEEMESAWQNGKEFSFLAVEFTDETNIPLELLLAGLQNEKTSILKFVNNTQEAEIAMKIMEKGSEGVILSTTNVEEIVKLDQYISTVKNGKLNLVAAKVTSVEHIEMGTRACVDITSIMSKKEGMIIGSTSSGGLLVSSETHYLPYMVTRPFRVNAGAIHSYIFTLDDNTQYLSELHSGSLVMVVDKDGNTRPASVGRMKIEVRPLLKIEAKVNNITINTIVQDDWHIRIFGADGSVMNASTIKPGDQLLAYVCQGGRHVGLKIDETLIEK